MNARNACTELLSGLDPDLFDYIVGILDDAENNDAEETIEMVSGFLQSAEFCASEDEALVKARAIFTKLHGSATKDNKPPEAPTIKKLVQPMTGLTLEEEGETENQNTADVVPPAPASLKPKMKRTTKLEKQQAKALRKAKKKNTGKVSASDQALAQALEIEAELEQARVEAVVSRRTLGAYRGALEAKAFTLPNPGGGQPLLEDAACTLTWGRRYGLIGRNGMGKSTLLRAFAARRVGDIPPNVTVHYVSQEVNLTPGQAEKNAIAVVVDADIERRLLLEELQTLEIGLDQETLGEVGLRRHGEVLGMLEDVEASSAERRARSLLSQLGFSEEMLERPLAQLSGGWRVRTMLAAAIFAKPDVLLLDEPTNHLSILAVMWLARELSTSDTWKERMVIIVSHDRAFMDEVCTDCLHISGAAKRLTQCRGNYSKWAKERREQQILFAKEQSQRQDEIDKLREYAGHGFKYGGSASQVTKMGMKVKQAEKLELIQANHATELAALQEDMELPMKLHAGGNLDGFIVQLLNVGFGYPHGTPARLFRECEFGITSQSRIVLLGENGQGKTTLVKVIMGVLEPTEGQVKRSTHARFAMVNQHHADQIDLSLTPLQFLAKENPGNGSSDHLQNLRAHLSSCGVTSGSSSGKKTLDLQNTPASALSGGQRSRVALASVSFAKPHVLVLDEPTNNLDLESVAALAESVKGFAGAVICVSHDQYFVEQVANEAWVVNAGQVKRVESFDVYRKRQLRVLNTQNH